MKTTTDEKGRKVYSFPDEEGKKLAKALIKFIEKNPQVKQPYLAFKTAELFLTYYNEHPKSVKFELRQVKK